MDYQLQISPNSTQQNCTACSNYVRELVSPAMAKQLSLVLFEFIPIVEIIEFHVLPFLQLVNLEKGTKLVVRDTYQKWYLSTIQEITTVVTMESKECICLLITYDGWGHKWNEWMEWPNPSRIRLVEGVTFTVIGVSYTRFHPSISCICKPSDTQVPAKMLPVDYICSQELLKTR